MSTGSAASSRRAQESYRLSAGQCLLHAAAAGTSWATVLGAHELQADRVRTVTRDFRAKLGAAPTWKVLGVGQCAAKAAELLRAAGETVEKVVERPDAFEVVHLPEEARLRMSKVELVRTEPVATPRPAKLKVLVVDDSASIRKLLTSMMTEDGDIEVVAAAELPSQVEDLIRQHRPDVITLDINMPEEDGVTLLKRIFPQFRIPTIMVTAIGLQEGQQVLDALASGAVDYVQKPDFKDIASLSALLREKVRAAAKAKAVRQPRARATSYSSSVTAMDPNSICVIGSSTGGTEALKVVLQGLPAEIPPILIVQHIPPVFSKAFADRMNQLCPFEVIEGSESGLDIIPNRVIIAAGGTQMGVKKVGAGYKITVDPAAGPVNRHKPSVDYLFDSVKEQFTDRKRAGAILTGMGADGARGMLQLKNKGWKTIAQDEDSCVVFGMPKEAIKLGAAESVLPLEDIAEKIKQLLRK